MSTPVKIAFVSTNYGPLWRPVVDSWLRCVAYTQRYLLKEGLGELGGIGLSDRMYVHSADNAMVRDLLADETLTHMMHVESDMLLADDTIVRLLALDKPIASGVYWLRNGNGQPCLFQRAISMPGDSYGMTPVSLYPQDTPFKLRGCPGLGCVLIKREVFEQLHEPWFDLKEHHYGSDLYFFSQVIKAGIETWVDPRVHCGQIDYRVWQHQDYVDRIKNDPEFAQRGYILGMTEVA